MRVLSLTEFPEAPALGTVTLEEYEGRVHNERESVNVIASYHKDWFPELAFIRLQDELCRAGSNMMSAKASIIRQIPSDMWAQLYESYAEHGLYGFLDHISSSESPPLRALALPARCILKGYRFAGSVHAFLMGCFFSHLRLSPDEICSKYAEVTNWKAGLVRAMAWHPGTKKLAIALRNDSVMLYSKNSSTSSELKHPRQTNVTCVAFRPFSGSHIAVGCEQGLLLWNILPSITVKTPTMHSATTLFPGLLISSMAWHPGGNLLAVCSARSGDIKIVNPSTGEVVPLTTFSILPSAHFLRWSHDGYRIFAPCPNGGFKIWQGNPVWDAQHYSSKLVTVGCWSYDGCHLLYALEGETQVYHLSLNPVGEPMAATPKPKPIINLDCHPEGISAEISIMEWDPNSQRLAIAFKHPSPLIALFQTKIKPLFSIEPLSFLRGPTAPEAMKFWQERTDGATLTVCWVSGQVQHIRMIFDVMSADRSVVLSRSAVSEISGDFSDESRLFHPQTRF